MYSHAVVTLGLYKCLAALFAEGESTGRSVFIPNLIRSLTDLSINDTLVKLVGAVSSPPIPYMAYRLGVE